jgi:murein L,D-transpeptidase YcbB/YkuD
LDLNLPAFRLDVFEGGRRVREIRVAVGTPDHPTPVGDFEIMRVVWNPWWYPPPFEWAENEKVTPPGPDNPTGRVKLFFGYYLFLHGTPLEESLGRAASHGCVRMSNADAIVLARLVHAEASPNVASALLDSLEADSRRTRSIDLEAPVPLAIRYNLVELREGRIEIHADIYRRGQSGPAEVLAAFERAGLDPARIDPQALAAAMREEPPLSVPLEQVLRMGEERPGEHMPDSREES